MTSIEQKLLDKRYEDFMTSLKKKDSVLYYSLRDKEKPVKESS